MSNIKTLFIKNELPKTAQAAIVHCFCAATKRTKDDAKAFFNQFGMTGFAASYCTPNTYDCLYELKSGGNDSVVKRFRKYFDSNKYQNDEWVLSLEGHFDCTLDDVNAHVERCEGKIVADEPHEHEEMNDEDFPQRSPVEIDALHNDLCGFLYCTNGEQCKIRTRIFVGYTVDQILSDRETMQQVSARQHVQYHDVVPPPPGVDASVVIMEEELEPLGVEVDVHYTGPMGPFSPIRKQPVQTGNTFGADFSLDEKGMMKTYSPPVSVVTPRMPVEEKQNVKKRDRPDAEVDKPDAAEELLKKQKQEEEAEQQKNQLLNQQLHAITLRLEEQKKELEEQRKISQHLMRVIATKVLDTAMPGEEFSGPKTGHEVAAAAFSNNEFENV